MTATTGQLHMVWPERLLKEPPRICLPDGYDIRPFAAGDESGHVKVMIEAGFDKWNEQQLGDWLKKALPHGVFVVVHKQSGGIVATAMAVPRATDLHPQGGELGWVAGSRLHSGKGLGAAVCSAALDLLLKAGFKRIYLMTDDWRLAAIKTYLRMGFVPFLYAFDMEERWHGVFTKLDLAERPDGWPRAPGICGSRKPRRTERETDLRAATDMAGRSCAVGKETYNVA